MKPRPSRTSLAPFVLFAAVVVAFCVPHLCLPQTGLAQDEPDEPDEPPPQPPVGLRIGNGSSAADFKGHLQIVKAPGVTPNAASKLGIDIFPEARKLPMSVHNVDPVPIERARRGGEWLCTKANCSAMGGVAGESLEGNAMLKSIKVQTPAMPVPVTIWRRSRKDPNGKLDFDPSLLTQRNYKHVCAYPPLESADGKSSGKKPDQMERCMHGEPADRRPDEGEIFLGFEWPRQAELAGFKYLAVVDSCGNALVYPFQRSFVAPAVDVVSGGCNVPDGRVLRIFPSGSFLRVTAFNLEAAASDDIVQVTYRVAVPPLENYSEAEPAKVLFPDFKLNELLIDCGPQLARGPVDAHGMPIVPGAPSHKDKARPKLVPVEEPPKPQPKKVAPDPVPGEEPPVDPNTGMKLVPDDGEDDAPPTGPPPKAPPPAAPPAGPPPPKGAGGPSAKAGADVGAEAKVSPDDAKGAGSKAGTWIGMTTGRENAEAGKAPPPGAIGAKPLNHGTLVIAPEPLREGNCRIVWQSPLRARLNVPLALHVSLVRTDRVDGNEPPNLLPDDQQTWIVTANDYTFNLPALRSGFDGNSRLKLIIRSDPLNPNGKAVLVGDAGRVAATMHDDDLGSNPDLARRTVGSITVHTVPLCGESNFETLEEAGSCIRAYLTIPAMLATLQITRAPWIEKPLITRSVLSAVGVALAFDSYDPVERAAFPVAGQIGGFVQNLEDDRIGLMGYAGVAPTLPILGEGGNTTTFGFLAGLGITYITNANGPDEGFKPTAFISVVVQVGQANPELSGQSTFGSYGQ
ncbi:MAG: hypothetical protein HOW73_03100 [Polyangiaceae bacterium]|nr:hypothetical protein [Polyangiaceae bacterium]